MATYKIVNTERMIKFFFEPIKPISSSLISKEDTKTNVEDHIAEEHKKSFRLCNSQRNPAVDSVVGVTQPRESSNPSEWFNSLNSIKSNSPFLYDRVTGGADVDPQKRTPKNPAFSILPKLPKLK